MLGCKAFSHVTPLFTQSSQVSYFYRALYNIDFSKAASINRKIATIMETQIWRHSRSKKAIVSLFSLNQFSVGSVQFNNSVQFTYIKKSLIQLKAILQKPTISLLLKKKRLQYFENSLSHFRIHPFSDIYSQTCWSLLQNMNDTNLYVHVAWGKLYPLF